MSQEKDQETEKQVEETPDESSGFAVQGHIKIYDPETGEIIVAKRG